PRSHRRDARARCCSDESKRRSDHRCSSAILLAPTLNPDFRWPRLPAEDAIVCRTEFFRVPAVCARCGVSTRPGAAVVNRLRRDPEWAAKILSREQNWIHPKAYASLNDSPAIRKNRGPEPTPGPAQLLPCEQILLNDRVHAPVAVHDLGDAEVHPDRHERDRLVLAEPARGHQEVAHLA